MMLLFYFLLTTLIRGLRGHEDVAMMLIFFRGLHRGSARTTMSHTGDGADINRRALGDAVVAELCLLFGGYSYMLLVVVVPH